MVYYNNIKLIDNKWQNIVENICRKIVEANNKLLEKLIVFGSVARKEANSSSDLDVYLEFNCDVMDENCIIKQDIVKSSDIITFETFGNCDICYSGLVSDKLYNNIVKDGIVLYERSSE